MIGRRHCLAAMLGALTVSRIAVAQPVLKRRLAIFVAVTYSEEASFWRPFFHELRRLGHDRETNLTVIGWSGGGDSRQFVPLAREIVAGRPDVVLAWGSRLALALREAGAAMPVVVAGTNLSRTGVVLNYARPGGNMTGISTDDTDELPGKRLELLHEIKPTAAIVDYLQTREIWQRSGEAMFRPLSQRRGLTPLPVLLEVPVDAASYRHAFAGVAGSGLDLLVVGETAENFVNRALIIELAAQHRLPAIYFDGEFVRAGGLMAYGYDATETTTLVARFVARMLNGENPAEVPVQVYDTLRLFVNQHTARTLGLTIPPAVLTRADEVIE
ncbi:MAG TPA: ABC transporter substrate-binding protein [Vineibacter sp.]|nr:ABC transporter substrate-binding protein [Vineibacter sp.]